MISLEIKISITVFIVLLIQYLIMNLALKDGIFTNKLQFWTLMIPGVLYLVVIPLLIYYFCLWLKAGIYSTYKDWKRNYKNLK